MFGEIWKPCSNDPGREVSTLGRVRLVDRISCGLRYSDRALKAGMTGAGYPPYCKVNGGVALGAEFGVSGKTIWNVANGVNYAP